MELELEELRAYLERFSRRLGTGVARHSLEEWKQFRADLPRLGSIVDRAKEDMSRDGTYRQALSMSWQVMLSVASDVFAHLDVDQLPTTELESKLQRGIADVMGSLASLLNSPKLG